MLIDCLIFLVVARQQKYMKEKFGGVDDALHDDEEEEEEVKGGWDGRKDLYYGADNRDAEVRTCI